MTRKATFQLLSIFVFIGFLLLVGQSIRAQTTLRVEPGESIQAVIESAAPGTTIELPPGTWRENLKIEKSITLSGAGAGKTIIAGKEAGHPVIWVRSPQTASVTIQGVTITGAYGESCADKEKRLCAHGILAQGDVSLTITASIIVQNALHGLYADDSAQVVVSNSVFSENYVGIWLTSSAYGEITNTNVSKNNLGIIIADHAQAKIVASTVTESDQDGIVISDSAQVVLSGNTIVKNTFRGISINTPECYNTERTFTGHVYGANNTVPGTPDERGNLIAVCPQDLGFLTAGDGGFFSTTPIDILLSSLPVSPPMKGDPNAPITIIEFTDFTCSYCAQFAMGTLPQLERDYIDTGMVNLYFLPFPVHGTAAYAAAEAVFCAQEQDLFWVFHELLFAQYRARGSSSLTSTGLTAIAAAAGADRNRFLESLTEKRYEAAVKGTIALGEKMGVNGTPTFFVNGRRVYGAASYEAFQQAINAALARLVQNEQ